MNDKFSYRRALTYMYSVHPDITAINFNIPPHIPPRHAQRPVTALTHTYEIIEKQIFALISFHIHVSRCINFSTSPRSTASWIS